MMLSILETAAIVLIAFMTGVLVGRRSGSVFPGKEKESVKRTASVEREDELGEAVGSPAAGTSGYFYEGMRRGIQIEPDQGRLFAPASGKIIKLYPMGNAMLFRTDYGVELLLQVGRQTDEMENRYFRPRVVRNEIVNKGKLLLEFDKEGMEAEGYDTTVILSVSELDYPGELAVSDAPRVKNGENILWFAAGGKD